MAEKENTVRFGFTTGSCAAAAAKAAAYMLLTGKQKNEITIETPKGIPYHAQIVEITRQEDLVRCAVIKDGGSDPDVTTGCHVFAEVTYEQSKTECEKNSGANDNANDQANISRLFADGMAGDCQTAWTLIDGGEGVGRVTLPGLDQPVGNAAINHVPREMIEKEVLEVCSVCDYHGGLRVTISVPEGRELADKTFNPRLGIVGGISILGTSGIVEPMSSKALLETIRVELNQKRALGQTIAAVSPGNYGLDFMKQTYDYDLDKSVKCSNFIGDTIDMAKELGFSGMLLAGHIGKLIKVSGGIMNTHSKEGDCRMELLAAAGLKAGCDANVARAVLETAVTEEGIRILMEAGCCEKAMEYVMERILFFLRKRGGEGFQIECMTYCNQYGLLAKSDGAEAMLAELMAGSQIG
ncbi:MAG: cobalt-precorrin-5B (C(1))-methyltransferase CbiD [Acetatifactor sp.]|nr:cobalt-precorrin-5B (C(1))-methyltransferase CbiD [Acetatifactor sp.]